LGYFVFLCGGVGVWCVFVGVWVGGGWGGGWGKCDSTSMDVDIIESQKLHG